MNVEEALAYIKAKSLDKPPQGYSCLFVIVSSSNALNSGNRMKVKAISGRRKRTP